jgi:threonine dehydrogenase-like Zn-dependent dehydrogenase
MAVETVALGPVRSGDVLVAGCGAVGLNVIQAAALRRAERVIAVDVNEAKLAQAIRNGFKRSFHGFPGEVHGLAEASGRRNGGQDTRPAQVTFRNLRI